ncbi:MAG TPA: hypothetical protein VHR45_14860 [Thermoanaerobaculia bacterium]|nr:hypothetical protein [Thermoanaerobaculia bacterium]
MAELTSSRTELHPESPRRPPARHNHRYVHFFDDPLRAAANCVTAEIDAAMRGGAPAEVIPLKPAH